MRTGEEKPVAWMATLEDGSTDATTSARRADEWRQRGRDVTPLYATPTPDARARAVTDEMVEAALSEYDCARANKWFPEAAMRSALERALTATTRGDSV